MFIRDPVAEKTSFQVKAKEGTFLAWSSIVPKGAWVAIKKDDKSTDIILTSLPNGWSRAKEKNWIMKKNPLGGEVVWLADDGDLRFGPPASDEVMTFEERRLPPHPDAHLMEDTVTRFHLGAGEQFFLSVHEEEDESGGGDGDEDWKQEDWKQEDWRQEDWSQEDWKHEEWTQEEWDE